MLKILSQILIVLLAISFVAGVTYLAVQQTSTTASLPGNGEGQFNGTRDGAGLRPEGGMHGEGGEQNSSGAWIEVLKNLGIIAAATGVISLARWVINRSIKPGVQSA